jgi:FMN phosphatase YigB (HAD superfamily)
MERIEAAQTGVTAAGYGVKRWSREVMIKIALDESGIPATGELISAAADAYWMAVSEHMEPYDHARELLDKLNRLGRPVFLVTSSDARLLFNQEEGTFIYDPVRSESLKRERMETLRTRLGLHFNLIVIGDPVGKPELYRIALQVAEENQGRKIEPGLCVAVGDSFKSDVEYPVGKLGFGLGVVFKAGAPPEVYPEAPRTVRVGKLTQIEAVLENYPEVFA